MSTRSGRSSLSLATPAAQQSSERIPLLPFLALTLFLPTMIVLGDFVLGVLTPITGGADGEMQLLDSVWRLVQGQHPGIDFHDPLGFGPPQVAAMLWRLLGPHCYVLRASADLFALVIIFCGCVVATRQLRQVAGLAALFCVTVAFVASGPSTYGYDGYFNMALSYNRLLMAGLLVLFVQSFANGLDARTERGYIDYFITAFLLNTLFLVKISGLVVGVAVVVVGLFLRGSLQRSLVGISLVLLFLAIVMTIDFVITGTNLSPVLQEYRMAAQGRVGATSVRDVLWFARRLPVLAVVGLMALYVVSRPGRYCRNRLWRCFCIIAFYWTCQVVLNMSNGAPPDLISLAPAAAVAVVTWTDTSNIAPFWDRLWRGVHPRRLHEISARQLIPLLILALVLGPEASASLRTVKLDYLISSGMAKTITVSANKGITFNILKISHPTQVSALNRAIQVIERLDVNHEKIANLDYQNPFPALFLAPDPKGVWVWWNFSRYTNVPVGYKPSWREVIGDACIVTEPKPETWAGNNLEPLIKAVEPHLAIAFTLIYHDELWNIWKQRSGCVAESPN
jgi:hypothetical protein